MVSFTCCENCSIFQQWEIHFSYWLFASFLVLCVEGDKIWQSNQFCNWLQQLERQVLLHIIYLPCHRWIFRFDTTSMQLEEHHHEEWIEWNTKLSNFGHSFTGNLVNDVKFKFKAKTRKLLAKVWNKSYSCLLFLHCSLFNLFYYYLLPY